MNDLFRKLNYKDQPTIYVVNAPESLADALDEMRAITPIRNSLTRARDAQFTIAFATRQKEVDAFAAQISKATTGDAVIWICYPKGSSKRYTCDFNRDTGWAELGRLGFEPVRQVAIDEDWSALRFRRVGFIKTMTRSFAMTEAGKAKAAAAKSGKARRAR
jgi:hypothetical protein